MGIFCALEAQFAGWYRDLTSSMEKVGENLGAIKKTLILHVYYLGY